MKKSTILSLILIISFSNCSSPYKRLPDDEKRFLDAVRVYMTPEVEKEYLRIKDPEVRKKFAKDLNLYDRYHQLPPEIKEAIAKKEILLEMKKDHVIMSWGKPDKVRKSVEDGLYWDIYYYKMVRSKDGEVSHYDKKKRYSQDSEFFYKLLYFNEGLLKKVGESPE